MEWDALHILGLIVLAVILVGLAALLRRESRRARSAVQHWAAERGMSSVRLHGTSLRPHPQIGKARTGDVTFRLTAVDRQGRTVTGFVKCNTFGLSKNEAADRDSVEAVLHLCPAQGAFPVVQVGAIDSGETDGNEGEAIQPLPSE